MKRIPLKNIPFQYKQIFYFFIISAFIFLIGYAFTDGYNQLFIEHHYYLSSKFFFIEPENYALIETHTSFNFFLVSLFFATICLMVGIIILFVTLPIYLYSKDKDRKYKAGGLVKTTLCFIIATGATLLGSFMLS